MRKDVLAHYSDTGARDYDGVRSGSARWANEIAAFEHYLLRVGPRTVVDCPFGTGRWIPQYDKANVSVAGVDLSADMLSQAREKVSQERAESYDLIEGSIFEYDFSALPEKPDLGVCVRFLNWIPADKVMPALASVSKAGSKHLVVGCSVIPSGTSPLRRLAMRAALRITNLRSPRNPPQYVHEESELLAHFSSLGWNVKEARFVFENKSRKNYFYLLERQ